MSVNAPNRSTSVFLGALATIGAALGFFNDMSPLVQKYITHEIKDESKSSTETPSVFNVNYLYKDMETGSLKPILPDTVLRSGDHYKVVFTPNQDGYVYLFQVDSMGQCFQLFPMHEIKGVQFDNGNPVKAGRRYVLPSEDRSFRLDHTVGRERLYLMITARPHEELESLAQRMDEARQSKNSKVATELNAQLTAQMEGKGGQYKSRGLDTVETDEVVNLSWNGTKEVFNTLGRSLRNICENCVYGVEFEHQ